MLLVWFKLISLFQIYFVIGLKKARMIEKVTLKAANLGCRGLLGRVVALLKSPNRFFQ